ncbi:MAG: S8 family serine peptidase [Desulfurococcaceae archaeon]
MSYRAFNRVPKYVLVLVLTSLLLVPLTPSMALAGSTGSELAPRYSRAYVSPALLDENYWNHGAYVEDPALLSFTKPSRDVFNLVEGVKVGQVIIVVDKSTPLTALKGKVLGLVAALPTHVYDVVIAAITRDQLDELARTPGVLAILPDTRLDALINREQRMADEVLGTDQLLGEVLQVGSGGTGSYHYTVNITGAIDVWTQYGVRGEDVKLAIIDTGVDYASPGLGLDAIARDEYGLPLVFDVSSLGLVLTPVKAMPTGDGYIVVDPAQLYLFYPPYYVFKWTAGLYVSVSGCRAFTGWLPFPEGNKWYIGSIPSSGVVRFGLMMQYVSTAIATIYYTVPVIVVDSNGDGYYDTLYADTSTALYLLRWALEPAPCSVSIPGDVGRSPDFSFADETPIKYGNEVVARDLNGDGLYDYSVGTLAGYVYDAAFGIILEKTGALKEHVTPLPPLYGISTYTLLSLETWSGETVALVWPGLDPYGDYVVIEYDYHSHGTFCATTAAGRDYYAETGYGVRSMSGQAPATKIAASPALYFGTVAVSVYFFTGFDIATPYGTGSTYLWPALLTNPWIAFEGWSWKWTYTGQHQVDITSNSYGISGWALWGWNSGMDPESLLFDYTTLVTGTAHFIAVGNGGPGYGTIASPAASSLSISVGAATEFTYRPIYGYAWPGSSRQVISWSNRGPTELGVVKPDVVAVGAFAWATGRTWQALGYRTLNGRLVHALFSGTSQATPMAAGVGALVVSAYKSKYGSRIPPYLLKTVLMNNAHDMGFDELSQGAGFVNAYKAVTAVLDPSYPRVYSRDLLKDLLSELSGTYSSVTYGEIPSGEWFEPKVFIPEVAARAVTRTITIEGAGDYKVYSTRLEAVETRSFCDLVKGVVEPAVITSCSGDSITLNVTAATVYGHMVVDAEALKKYDYFEIEVIYPFEYFEAGGRTGAYNNTISSSILELAYWIDVGADGRFSWLETARIYYNILGGNALRVQMGDLEGQISEIEHLARAYMGVEPTTLPRYLVVRLGVSGATYRGLIPVKARVVGYQYKPWAEVYATPSRVLVGKGEKAVVNLIVRAPANPGFYSGYVVVEEAAKGFRALVPVSFFVPVELREERIYAIKPYTENTPRKNTYLRGAFDYTWRYESGDWRVFKVIVHPALRDPWALGVRVTWPVYDKPEYASNVDVHVYGPYTYYMVDPATLRVYEYTVNSVQLAAELSRDPRGGGSYNPTRFWDSVEPGLSMVVSPALTPGVYRVVVRNIQFRGVDYAEPFTVELIPVVTRITAGYNAAVKGYELLLSIRTQVKDLLPAVLNATNTGMVYTDTGTYYIPDLLKYGLVVYTEVVSVTSTVLDVRVVVKPTDTAPKGAYIVPLEALMKMPVTTVGWIDGGTARVYFEWYSIPLYLPLTVW